MKTFECVDFIYSTEILLKLTGRNSESEIIYHSPRGSNKGEASVITFT